MGPHHDADVSWKLRLFLIVALISRGPTLIALDVFILVGSAAVLLHRWAATPG